jgi:1-acyl-sn-glycerol-3-phosphate acyltransferase
MNVHPDRPHIRLYSDEGDREILTYRQLGIGAQAIAAGLQEKGLLPGEDARRIVSTARKDRSLFFFAEGTFTRIPGLRPFHMGAFEAAVEADVPVVPIAIHGTHSILRDVSLFPRRGIITVIIGKPIEHLRRQDPSAPDSWTKAIKLRDAAREHILQHCGEPDLSGQ